MRQKPLSSRRYSSKIERQISDLVENERWVVIDLAREAGIDRSFLSKIRHGQSMSAANSEAVLNAMGYTLTITKIEKENEDAA
jgi:transcriptional regulator with XRE-family HTH domain